VDIFFSFGLYNYYDFNLYFYIFLLLIIVKHLITIIISNVVIGGIRNLQLLYNLIFTQRALYIINYVFFIIIIIILNFYSVK